MQVQEVEGEDLRCEEVLLHREKKPSKVVVFFFLSFMYVVHDFIRALMASGTPKVEGKDLKFRQVTFLQFTLEV